MPRMSSSLEQHGPKVEGSVRRYGAMPGQVGHGELSGPIEGTVAGDVFSFRQTNGSSHWVR